MTTIDDLKVAFDRFEREQKVRDQGLLRSFDIFARELKRLQQMVSDQATQQRLPMDMAEFITLMTTMLNRQQQLLEAIGEEVEDPASWPEDEAP